MEHIIVIHYKLFELPYFANNFGATEKYNKIGFYCLNMPFIYLVTYWCSPPMRYPAVSTIPMFTGGHP